MAKSRKRKQDSLPEQFQSLEEAGEFWDAHGSTDYEEYMQEAHFDVDLKRYSTEVRVSDELPRGVRKIARRQGVATKTLINLWLQEKVAAKS
ncbi:MAG: BrnA antitoxin family protein [Acidobacteriota bacterium]|nr:BrnA antitoxin family protein [Acidobacteriota bacterium]